jgi:hypothetical protein
VAPERTQAFEFSPIPKPLEKFADHVVVERTDRPARRRARARPICFLSGDGRKTERRRRVGTTLDQVIARRSGRRPPSSIEVANEDSAQGRRRDNDACPLEYDPRRRGDAAADGDQPAVAFSDVWRHGTGARVAHEGEHPDRSSRGQPPKSTLMSDSAAMDAYLENVREYRAPRAREEQRYRGPMDVRGGVPTDFREHVGLLFDLLAIVQSDTTRVFSFMMARELSQRTYPEIGCLIRTTRCRTTATSRC